MQTLFLSPPFCICVGRTIFIKEIIAILKKPEFCPRCMKSDRLEEGTVREERTGGSTLLCTRCEALTVVTNQNIRRVELSSSRGDVIMLKEPHLIRRVG